MTDNSGPNFFAEQTLEQIFVERQSILRKDGISQLLELLHNFVIQAGIMMVRASQHDDADTVFAFQLVHYLASSPADAALVVGQRFVAHLDGTVVLFL